MARVLGVPSPSAERSLARGFGLALPSCRRHLQNERVHGRLLYLFMKVENTMNLCIKMTVFF